MFVNPFNRGRYYNGDHFSEFEVAGRNAWTKPNQQLSMYTFIVQAAGGGGRAGTTTSGGGGGGAGAGCIFMLPEMFVPDALIARVGNGGGAGATGESSGFECNQYGPVSTNILIRCAGGASGAGGVTTGTNGAAATTTGWTRYGLFTTLVSISGQGAGGGAGVQGTGPVLSTQVMTSCGGGGGGSGNQPGGGVLLTTLLALPGTFRYDITRSRFDHPGGSISSPSGKDGFSLQISGAGTVWLPGTGAFGGTTGTGTTGGNGFKGSGGGGGGQGSVAGGVGGQGGHGYIAIWGSG